jgi:hypothetical protein
MMPQELLAKSQELHDMVDGLVEIVADAINNQTPIHEVESKAHATLLRAGQTTLQLLVDCLGQIRCPRKRHDRKIADRKIKNPGPRLSGLLPYSCRQYSCRTIGHCCRATARSNDARCPTRSSRLSLSQTQPKNDGLHEPARQLRRIPDWETAGRIHIGALSG